ncbi:sialate O-acetylesterase [Haloferula sp.]|uniref:sialate O-acetylesterase n=1 Tax=Haloferula sp. TaxID=2497595 RepID=UPI00329F13EC
MGLLMVGQLAAQPLKVYILAGQSNMLGLGQVAGKESPGTVENLISSGEDDEFGFLANKSGKIAEQEDVWVYFDRDGELLTQNLAPGLGKGSNFIGPELGFGEQIQKQEDQQILLIKIAWGGKSLGKDFRPPSAGGATGPYYTRMVEQIHDALGSIKKHFPRYKSGDGYEIAGLFWHQGWNDRINKSFTDEYPENMKALIKDLRSEFKTDFPVVIATTGMATKRDAMAGKAGKQHPIEKAQLSLASKRDKVAVVDTKKLWIDPKKCPSSGGGQHYHWNQSAEIYINIGKASAEEFEALSK